MNATRRYFSCAPLFRIWDPVRQGFGFCNQQPNDGSVVEVWTGRFDREGRPVYEQDIISVHHDWKLGWVRALVVRRAGTSEFVGQATGPDGAFQIGAFEFTEGYVEGNLHQHPQCLFPAMAQFPEPEPLPSSRLERNNLLGVFGTRRSSRKDRRWTLPSFPDAASATTSRPEYHLVMPAIPVQTKGRATVRYSRRAETAAS